MAGYFSRSAKRFFIHQTAAGTVDDPARPFGFLKVFAAQDVNAR
jgi:hypothetical protein